MRIVQSLRPVKTDKSLTRGGLTLCIAAICAFQLAAPLSGQTGWQTAGNTIYAPAGTLVGIGTASPQYKLDLRDSVSTVVVNAQSTVNSAFFLTSGPAGYWNGYVMRVGNTNRWYVGSNGAAENGDNSGSNLLIQSFTDGGAGYMPAMLINRTTGNVGIATTTPQYKLAVNGTIGAKDVIVTNTGWPDYVFQPGYRLRPLSDINTYIKKHHRLPGIPSETEVREKGVSLGEMQAKLLAKIEELTLHMIEADERNGRLEKQNQELRDRIAKLEAGSAQ